MERWVKYKRTRYEVSSYGRVKNTYTDKIVSAHLNEPNGYWRVNVKIGNKWKLKLVHVMVAECFLGKRPKGKTQINHKDTNKQNCRVKNLEYVTQSENMDHAFSNGLFPDRHGKNNSNYKHGRRIKKQ